MVKFTVANVHQRKYIGWILNCEKERICPVCYKPTTDVIVPLKPVMLVKQYLPCGHKLVI